MVHCVLTWSNCLFCPVGEQQPTQQETQQSLSAQDCHRWLLQNQHLHLPMTCRHQPRRKKARRRGGVTLWCCCCWKCTAAKEHISVLSSMQSIFGRILLRRQTARDMIWLGRHAKKVQEHKGNFQRHKGQQSPEWAGSEKVGTFGNIWRVSEWLVS